MILHKNNSEMERYNLTLTNIDFRTNSNYFFGGIMQRLFRLSFLAVLLCLLGSVSGLAQLPQALVSGRIAPGTVRVFLKDSVYIIDKEYVVGGTLIIEPGTTVYFSANSRIIDSVGGRIIADGFARATYNERPNNIDPVQAFPAETGGAGYADMNYFLYNSGAQSITVSTKQEKTVNKEKYNHIFNVLVDKTTRKIVDLVDPNNSSWSKNPLTAKYDNANQIILPFEYALMFHAARLNNIPDADPNLKIRPWSRLNYKTVNVTPGTIRFIGQFVNDISREWGNIVVLPGARGAFFRNVRFEGLRKDITTGTALYSANSQPGLSIDAVKALNDKMSALTTGAGGALTTFSSRTWLLNATFTHNFARNRGGALQILQAPKDYFPMPVNVTAHYPLDKNPNITDKNGDISTINNNVPFIDNVDDAAAEPLSDFARQAWDDGRISMFLGRVRNLKFDRNKVQISNVGKVLVGTPPVLVVKEIEDAPADYPYEYGNKAFGGALYIAGDNEDVHGYNSKIEVGLGINNRLLIGGVTVDINPGFEDSFEATYNEAKNFQAHMSSHGARGGAIYAGQYTSLIVAGNFSANETHAKFLMNDTTTSNNGYFAMGGAIYTENTDAKLTLRGGPNRQSVNIENNLGATLNIDNSTMFYRNKAGVGGAIYVDGNTSDMASPVIGGSDVKIPTREYGYNIKLNENEAVSFGGAIFTRRNMTINGAGGVHGVSTPLYGGLYPVKFEKNKAGFSGGAITIFVPNDIMITTPQKKSCEIVRAHFEKNVVGEGINDQIKNEIRGGGAIYAINGDLSVIKGTTFALNTVYNGNGGAIAQVSPETSAKRFYVSDLDQITYSSVTGLPNSYTSVNEPFTYSNAPINPDSRMLTRFLGNRVIVDDALIATQMGSGTTQIGKGTEIPTDNLSSTVWIDNNNGYAVGENGLVIKMTQAGTKWDYLPSNTNEKLNKIQFINDQVGFIAGEGRTILKTTNAGTTWTNTLTSGLDIAINDVNFIGTSNGIAVADGGSVFFTNNTGNNWTEVQPSTRHLYSVAWTNSTTAYAVGEKGLLLKSTNMGANWDIQIIPGLTTDLKSIVFKSASVGYAVGSYGVIIKTVDGGLTWDFVSNSIDADLKSIYFIGQSTGYIAGSGGTIIKTTDGGDTWSALASNEVYNMNSVYFTNLNNGYVAGSFGTVLATKDAGATWTNIRPKDERYVDVKRIHQETSLPENGIGLGGALYILDEVAANRIGRADSIQFNRVRIEDNFAYTGSAVYSDNYDLKLIFNRSLITANNVDTRNTIGVEQNRITGPVFNDSNHVIFGNFASSDLAPATIYGEIHGPLPSHIFSEAANSIYGNNARFLIRLPDAPNTKGVLEGNTGIGSGGTDTLRGNYWGHTEANVIMELINQQSSTNNPSMETFFVDYGDKNYLPLVFNTTSTDPRLQGPFESIGVYNYSLIPLLNGATENEVGTNSIPEKILFSGRIYDMYDKGTDIKTADYSKRRMTPIEDFAVGIPPIVKRFTATGVPSTGKYLKRYLRDPFVAEAVDPATSELKYEFISKLQGEWQKDKDGLYYHPLGYPVYLESKVDYTSGDIEILNHDTTFLNESVFFVINETTGDYIRVNFKQVDENNKREIFRARVELVPDSSNRNPNTTIRRTAEGILNLGFSVSYPYASYNTVEALKKLEKDAYVEDQASLAGRRYSADYQAMGKVQNLFSNRPAMPNSNLKNAVSNTTYYAGERYRALPVDTGDVVRVISRTVLWREGWKPAYDDGIVFKVSRSTMPPVFTGDIVKLTTDTIFRTVPSKYPWETTTNDTITEFIRKIFVTENRSYPVADGFYSNGGDPTIGIDAYGRDSILTVTAVDTNKFFNPYSVMFPNMRPSLTYEWNVASTSGLKRWLMVDTVTVTNGNKNGADGYLQFKGQPLNPYVVPGGEEVAVRSFNFPPNYRTVDSLKKAGVSADTIAKLIEIYPRYFNTPNYVDSTARYLQQDTIDFGYMSRAEEKFMIFVVDSTPKFLDPGTTGEAMVKLNVNSNDTEMKQYIPTEYICGTTVEGKLKANLTDALRFKVDFNTDDELEDSWAIDWDFRYGKTAYGFENISYRPTDADTIIVIDTIYGSSNVISQVRPSWMANKYMKKYANATQPDNFGVDFLTKGQINISVPRTEAVTMLTPSPLYNAAMNTDTLFTVVVNDGHGSVKTKTMPIFINVAPQILNSDLEIAYEDEDYNPQLLDSLRRVIVYDPNVGQTHKYELVYANYPVNTLPKDPCFAEAGEWDLTNMKTTPAWLKIDAHTGLLYGTPRVQDAPKNEKVTVVVTDSDGLITVKQFDLNVRPTNHPPTIVGVPAVRCVDEGKPYEDFVIVKDSDLLRTNSTEELTLKLIKPSNASQLSISPNTIKGTGLLDSAIIRLFTSNFNIPRDGDNKVTIQIEVVDQEGLADTLTYRLELSLPTDFICDVKVENNLKAFKVLSFGTAAAGATTGDGIDLAPTGTIDYSLCEFEVPPLPPNDVFDARWQIPTRNGIYRNIFPKAQQNQENTFIYKANFQAGGVSASGSTAPLFPVTISWKPNEIPAKTDATANPAGSTWYLRDISSNGNIFSFDMRNPDNGSYMSDIQARRNAIDPEIFEVILNNDKLDAFVILHDWISGVEDGNTANSTKITQVSPNPITNNALISFSLEKSSDVKMEVVDMLGNKVAEIVNAYYNAGTFQIEWNGRNLNGQVLPSAAYQIRMTAGKEFTVFPIAIVK